MEAKCVGLNQIKEDIIKAITGEKNIHLTDTWQGELDALIEEVKSLSTFSPVSRQEKCSHNEALNLIEVDHLVFESKSLSQFLQGAESCILMAATLGPRIESRMNILQLTDMAKAYLFDIVCLHYLEYCLNEWENKLREEIEGQGLYLSNRFSPGYGDLKLDLQGAVLTYLDAQKRVGIELTNNNLMIPQKSVTAVLGVSRRPFKRSYSRCDACLKRDNCQSRGGKHCAFQ